MVEVTQEDRNRLAAYYKARQEAAWANDLSPHGDLLLQAFAAHREAGRLAERNAVVAFLESSAWGLRCAQVIHGSVSDMCANAIREHQHLENPDG